MDEISPAVETFIHYGRALTPEERQAAEHALMASPRKGWNPANIDGLVCWYSADRYVHRDKTGAIVRWDDVRLTWWRRVLIFLRLHKPLPSLRGHWHQEMQG